MKTWNKTNLENLVVICDDRLVDTKQIMSQIEYNQFLIDCNNQWKSDSDDPDNYVEETDFEMYNVLDYFLTHGNDSLVNELEIYFYYKK